MFLDLIKWRFILQDNKNIVYQLEPLDIQFIQPTGGIMEGNSPSRRDSQVITLLDLALQLQAQATIQKSDKGLRE